MRLRHILVITALAVCAPSNARAGSIEDGAPAPFTSIRSLQMLQEQVAHGNGAAQAAQPKLMAHIAERFLEADPEVWKEPRNARAIVVFLLSGGKPSVARSILAKAVLPTDMDKLVKGALAYAEGDDDSARSALGSIDPKSLPSMLGGQLALVQASLLSSQDEVRASKLLDLARLLVPGTLVEEAALRRQMFLLAGPETFDKFVFLSRHYIRRFKTSIYADNFKQHLTSVAKSVASSGDVGQLAKFDTILSEYPANERIGFYLVIAKTAIVQGKADAARYAADKASVLAGSQGDDGARSALYAGAALIVSDDAAKGVKALKAIDPSRLSAQDGELQQAALAVAAGVRAEPSASTLPGADAPAKADGASGAVLDHARSALADTDKLLGVQTR